MTGVGKWPGGLRWIVRRVKPSRRETGNLTADEKKTGWWYSITSTNIRITECPAFLAATTQFIDVTHRWHAVVETGGVRTAKAMGLPNLPRSPGRSTRAGASLRTSQPT